jgi:hypothetical protein
MAEFQLDPEGTRPALARWEKDHAPLVAALEKFEKEELPGRFATGSTGRPWESESWTVLDVVESGKKDAAGRRTTLGGDHVGPARRAEGQEGRLPPKTFKVTADGKPVGADRGARRRADHVGLRARGADRRRRAGLRGSTAAGRLSVATQAGLDPARESKPQAVRAVRDAAGGREAGPDAAAIYGRIDPRP